MNVNTKAVRKGTTMLTYIFFREGTFYPIAEESDELILEHIRLNPGTLKVEALDGRVVWKEGDPL